MSKLTIQGLFSTPVGLDRIDRELDQSEMDFIKGQDRHRNGGTHASYNTYLLDAPELSKLRSEILDVVNNYFQTIYAPDTDVKLRLTQSWANYGSAGEYMNPHVHPNSVISGTYYPLADSAVDKVHFHRTSQNEMVFGTKDWNQWNSMTWWFPVGSGMVVMFPSYARHAVEAMSKERISIAFNTFPIGTISYEGSLMELKL